MTDKITNHSQQTGDDDISVAPVQLQSSAKSGLSADTHDFIKEELEKEIEEREKGCDCAFKRNKINERTGYNDYICGKDFLCVDCTRDVRFIEAKLSQHLATKQAMINMIKGLKNNMNSKSFILQKLGELKT